MRIANPLTRGATLTALLALAVAGCQPAAERPEPAVEEQPSPEAPTPPAAPPFEGTTSRLEVSRDASFTILEEVREARREGYERVVFEFRDGLPSHRIEYTERPIEHCASGKRIEVEGEHVLLVRMQPTAAHEEVDERVRETITRTDRRPGFPLIRHLVETCDYHGGVTWAVGLSQRAPMRVLELQAPARLVLDLREP